MSAEDLFRHIWSAAGPLKGPVIEVYYNQYRRLAVPETKNLRFCDSLKNYKNGGSYPAILARAENVNGVMTGIQRMWLAHDRAGKALVPKGEQKMLLGAIRGSMVRLADPWTTCRFFLAKASKLF
jgi:DNA primase